MSFDIPVELLLVAVIGLAWLILELVAVLRERRSARDRTEEFYKELVKNLLDEISRDRTA